MGLALSKIHQGDCIEQLAKLDQASVDLPIGDEYAAELKVLCTRELGLHCRILPREVRFRNRNALSTS